MATKQTGDRYADKGRRSAGAPRPAGETLRPAGDEPVRPESPSDATAATALLGLAVHDNGWLRIVSHELGEKIYFKFKFSRGAYAGSYVFVRCDDLDVTSALFMLLHKVRSVEAGDMRPTPDHPYE